jgi:hypothetical protein
MGISLGMVVEGSVTILLAVTIVYCIILNARLKRLHQDREQFTKVIGDLVQATALAKSAVMELKTAALDADTQLSEKLLETERFERQLGEHVANGRQLIEKISRITAAAKAHALAETQAAAEQAKPAANAKPSVAVEPQSRLHSALQQLSMRPGIGGRAA